jgi:shikimate dehydrogenase
MSVVKPPRAYLFAHPARHSLSPIMHDAALEAMGIDARYEARDISPHELSAALEALRTSGAWGANLSIPHKEAALESLDTVTAEARGIGAVNTVTVRNGGLEGTNTDAAGFMRSLEEAGVRVKGADVVVLGAGGAARAVCWALKRAGALVVVWNRTPARARQLAEELELEAFLTDSLLPNAIWGSSGLVNTTSVGLEQPDESPVADELLPMGGENDTQWVCDIVYRPLETKLLRNARRVGMIGVDGLGMLVHQGALALELWLDAQGIPGKPDPEIMRRAALRALGIHDTRSK